MFASDVRPPSPAPMLDARAPGWREGEDKRNDTAKAILIKNSALFDKGGVGGDGRVGCERWEVREPEKRSRPPPRPTPHAPVGGRGGGSILGTGLTSPARHAQAKTIEARDCQAYAQHSTHSTHNPKPLKPEVVKHTHTEHSILRSARSSLGDPHAVTVHVMSAAGTSA